MPKRLLTAFSLQALFPAVQPWVPELHQIRAGLEHTQRNPREEAGENSGF